MAIGTGVPGSHLSAEESNALTFALFASGTDGQVFIASDYTLRYANPTIMRTVDILLEDALGRSVKELIPGWSPRMDKAFRKIRRTRKFLTVDFYPLSLENRPERDITYWKVTINPVEGMGGAFLGWALVLMDVTRYKRNEDEKSRLLQDLEKKVKLLSRINDNSLAGLAIIDGSALTYKWVNKAFADFLKPSYPLDRLVGLSFEESPFPEPKNEWLASLRQVARTRIPIHDSLLSREQTYWNCSILPMITQAALPDLIIVVYDITEKITSRKLIEDYARQADRHLHQLETVIENMSDGVIIFDLRGKILNLNSVALRHLGYANRQDCPDYLSQTHKELALYDLEGHALPDESWPSNQILRGENLSDFEAAIQRIGTGVVKYSSYNGALIHGPDRESAIAVLTIRDVTEREILIRELAHEQARLQAVLEQMPCGVIIFDASLQKRVLANKKYTELWRFDAAGSQLGEQNWPGKFFHPDGRLYLQAELPIVRTIQRGETVANEEMHCQRQDGSWMVVFCNSTPIYDREGKIVAGVVVFSDITELKEATTKAALANQLQQIIEFLPDGIFVVDQNRRVIAWNRGLELLTGISKGEIVGTGSYRGIFGDGHRETLIDQVFNGISVDSGSGALRSGEAAVQQFSLPALNRRENVMLDLKATPIRNEQGEVTGVIETIRDITRQKQMEAETIRMQKLDSLGILAGGIAHDFNNILAAILVNLQLASLKLGLKEDIAKYLDGSIEITRKASDLTRQLLTFAKGGAPVKKTASILDLISETVEFALRGSKVKARFNFRENPWAVEIDEGQITQVINNITINAVQAMPTGGFLEIAFQNMLYPADSRYGPGRYVKLSFHDSGCGIPADIIDKIFDPFFTTKEVGNGLGLSTSYSIVKKHNGFIEAESVVGKGSTFHIHLPAATGEAVLPKRSREVAVSGESKILLMDDDEVIRQVVGDILAYHGYRVTIAKDGQEAIDYYRQAMSGEERFDVVIMDLTVPGGMGGLETMAVLRRIDPQVRAIISSGYANAPVMSDYKEYGFCGFVAKPYKFDELIEILNTALVQER